MKHLLFTLIIASATSAWADDYVVIVFDNSGSMSDSMGKGQSRMEVAQNALIQTLSKVPVTTHVGVLTFDGWIYELSQVNQQRIGEVVRGTIPGGGTPLYQYIKAGADRLLKEREKQGNIGFYKLIVVTDGEAQDDGLNNRTENHLTYTEDIIARGIVIDVIGLDMNDDHSLKTKINGSYMRGDDPESIQHSLSRSVAEVGFRGNTKLAAEAFQSISEMPDNFVQPVLTGLTKYQNQPIGELASGQGVTQVTPIAQDESPGLLYVAVGFGISIAIVMAFIFIIAVRNNL